MTINHQVPTGLVRRSSNVKGYWTFQNKTPVYFIPRTARTFDGSIEKAKPSILIIGELIQPCEAVDKDGNAITLEKGDTVGVWYKPGMRDIAGCKDTATWLCYTHDLDIDKPQPMKVFDVRSANGGKPLQIEYDGRIASADTLLGLEISPSVQYSPLAQKMRDRSRNHGNSSRGNRSVSKYAVPDDDNIPSEPSDDDGDIPLDDDGKPIF